METKTGGLTKKIGANSAKHLNTYFFFLSSLFIHLICFVTNKYASFVSFYTAIITEKTHCTYLKEGEVRVSMKMCDLQVAVDNLAASVEQSEGLVVIFQAGGQVQLHVCTQAHCNTDNM